MAGKRATTVAEYIRAAPSEGQPHLHRLHEILKAVAPKAEEVIKWGNPFFVEPRFVFAFSACKAHLNFAPGQAALQAFAKELTGQQTTKHYLQVRYDAPLPEALIRKIARYSVKAVKERQDDAFWG